MLKILTIKFISSLLGFISVSIALAQDDVFREYMIYSPMSLIITAFIDRGRGEYALRIGIPSPKLHIIRCNLLKIFCALILSSLIFATFEDGDYKYFLIIIISLQGFAQAYIDILMRNCTRRYNKIDYIMKYQISVSAITLLALIGSRYLDLSEFAALNLIILSTFTWILMDEYSKEERQCLKDIDLPSVSMFDLIAKLMPTIFYSFIIAFDEAVVNINYAARAYLFVTGIFMLHAIANKNESQKKNKFLENIIAIFLVFYGLKLIPSLFRNIDFDEIIKINLNTILNDIALIVSMSLLAILTTKFYSWNLKR